MQHQRPRPDSLLVVDDDPIIRDMMCDILESESLPVQVARNGIEALQLLRGPRAYMVFLDVMMPGMTGKDVCDILAHEPEVRQRHVIILMSALDQLDKITSCDVDAIITKPFVVEDVMSALERFVG